VLVVAITGREGLGGGGRGSGGGGGRCIRAQGINEWHNRKHTCHGTNTNRNMHTGGRVSK